MKKAMKKVKKLSYKQLEAAFQAYRLLAQQEISRLQNPKMQEIFNLAAYKVEGTMKKPQGISAPELTAIVATAEKVGKKVRVSTQGWGDGTTLYFHFVDRPEVNAELYQ